MNLFQIFGTIAVKNQEANRAIDETADKAKEAAATLGDKFTTIGNKISGIGKAIAPVSATLAAALTASTKSASDFQNGMAKMSTLFDTSKNSVNALGKEFLALSNKTGLSATELAEAGYQALSAGQSVETVGKFVETAGNLAKAGFTSTTTAVDVLTTAINAYGSEAGTAEQISNKLVRTQNLGKTTVDELASSMGKIIPTASSMGVNINNLTSGYVSLTKQGIATAEATTYMNSMFNELGDSGTTLGGIIKNKTGMSFQDCMRSGMSLADVLQITKQYADENGIAYNELWSSAEAGKASLAILNGGVEEFNKTVETMASDTNDVSEALNKLNTPSEKVHKALNRIKNSGIELGNAFINALVPVLDSVCNIVERATTWFNNLDDSTKTLIASMMGIGAIASPLLIIGGKVISVVGTVISSISSLSGVLAALTSPIGIVIAAIAGLVVAGVALYKNWDIVKEKCSELWANVTEKFSAIAETVSEAVENIKTWVNNMVLKIPEIATEALEKAKTFAEDTRDKIVEFIGNAKGTIPEVVTTALDKAKNLAETARDKIVGFIGKAKGTIPKVVTTALDVAKTLTGKARDKIVEFIGNAKGKLPKINVDVLDKAKDAVERAIEKIKGFFNFSWSLPPLKLPHFTISGSFSLMPPSVPTIGVSWYKKAMDEPYMFTRPTIFDVNPVTGQAKGAGEAGDEVMIGKETMLNMIGQAVASENKELIGILKLILHAIYDFDEGLIEKLIYAFTNMQFQINDREFARLVRAVR